MTVIDATDMTRSSPVRVWTSPTAPREYSAGDHERRVCSLMELRD
ncbi:hypothetical protein [Iamia sp.]|nr:hypothetical protein [Iamia sp.]HXH59487.1 hypothetical protein [Iamia sp.]